MADKITIRCYPELKKLIESAALKECLIGGMGEYTVRILAAHFSRPDLAKVPRGKRGPKNGRKDLATA